ncbi:MAG: hypothetical protein ISR52_07530 [Rhodospirillales bacterium]|nr:hypothetical protein [Rhodospirillales bacterium]
MKHRILMTILSAFLLASCGTQDFANEWYEYYQKEAEMTSEQAMITGSKNFTDRITVMSTDDPDERWVVGEGYIVAPGERTVLVDFYTDIPVLITTLTRTNSSKLTFTAESNHTYEVQAQWSWPDEKVTYSVVDLATDKPVKSQ